MYRPLETYNLLQIVNVPKMVGENTNHDVKSERTTGGFSSKQPGLKKPGKTCNHFEMFPVRYFDVFGYPYIITAKYQLLRKLTAIVLFAAFFISQYAKQAGYLECRLANYFSTATIKCDCEKILLPGNGQAMPTPAPVSHNHLHLDELFYPAHQLIKETAPVMVTLFLTADSTMLHAGIPERIDRPPQFWC